MQEALNANDAIIAETPAINKHASDPRLLKRIQILLWVTAIGILLSIPAIIVASISPDFAVASTVWALLTYGSFSFLYHSIEKTLLLPLPNGKMPNWWLRAGATKLRPHVYFMLSWVSVSFATGASYMFIPWLATMKTSGVAGYGLGSLTSALIIYTLFAIVWTHMGSRIDRFFSTRWGKALIIAIAVAGYAVVFGILTYDLISSI